MDEALRRLDLVRREELEVLEDRVAALEAALAVLERPAIAQPNPQATPPDAPQAVS